MYSGQEWIKIKNICVTSDIYWFLSKKSVASKTKRRGNTAKIRQAAKRERYWTEVLCSILVGEGFLFSTTVETMALKKQKKTTSLFSKKFTSA